MDLILTETIEHIVTTLRDQFLQNTAADSGGGAIYCTDERTMIDGCTFDGNTTNSGGGGGAIRSGESDGQYQNANQFTRNAPDDVAYQENRYPAKPRKSAAKGRKGGQRCWIVTAYFGDAGDLTSAVS